MYLAKQNFAKAQYCFEELLGVNPTNYLHNLKYAEILYSQAVATNNSITLLEQARKYFAHALVLIDNAKDKKSIPPNLVRALWGLLRCAKAIKQVNGKKEDAKNEEMLEITGRRLKELYGAHSDLNIERMQLMQEEE
mmetsp:Transcript_24144/g.37091  ORF Transcript_24144/g.37091 Transcript_24144/m.37091 type:complete len:137 (+) Transcript_24144:530-940(+)